MTVDELRIRLEPFDGSEPVRVYAGDLRQMFEVLDVELGEAHTYLFAQIDVITKELGE